MFESFANKKKEAIEPPPIIQFMVFYMHPLLDGTSK